MKKSNKILLTFLTGTVLSVAGCKGNEEQKPFTSVADCVQAGSTQDDCKKQFELAKAEHLKTAPKFDKLDECVAEFGANMCKSETVRSADGSQHSVFLPLMLGYWMGGGFSHPTPAYRSTDGHYYNNARQVSKSATTSRINSAKAAKAAKVTTSRGGFGGSARSSVGG